MLNESQKLAVNSLRPTRARYVVLALIVAAYVITYMDRVNISSAMPVIQRILGFGYRGGMDLQLVSLGIRPVSNTGGMVWRQSWTAARPGLHRLLVVALHLPDRGLLECDFARPLQISVWRGRIGSFPHCHPSLSRGCRRKNAASRKDCPTRLPDWAPR